MTSVLQPTHLSLLFRSQEREVSCLYLRLRLRLSQGSYVQRQEVREGERGKRSREEGRK